MTEEDTLEALNVALADYDPPRSGLEVFTADKLTPAEEVMCIRLCARSRLGAMHTPRQRGWTAGASYCAPSRACFRVSASWFAAASSCAPSMITEKSVSGCASPITQLPSPPKILSHV